MHFFRIRRILTDISGQIVKIIQTVIINAGRFYVADLRKDLSFRRLHRNLYITWDGKHIIAFKSIALAHSVQRVIQPEILRPAAQHRLSDIKNPFQNPFVIHNITHPQSVSSSLFVSVNP